MDFELIHKEGNQYKIELTRPLGGGCWVENFDTDEVAIKDVKDKEPLGKTYKIGGFLKRSTNVFNCFI